MEEIHDLAEDADSSSTDSFIVDSEDDEGPSLSGEEISRLNPEEPLTEEEINDLVAEFLEVESKAAEAQESLEKESLAKVESEVREELSQTLNGDDLETSVADEMSTFIEEWESVLDGLETESAHLLEQLDGVGVELPSLYKIIESQAPNVCQTEAWKKRAHWVGSHVPSECIKSVIDAENYLQAQRPVRRKHGKLLEEGAGGYLQKKLATDGSKDAVTDKSEVDWHCLSKILSDKAPGDQVSFGSENWASVYLANTPQQAAMMGIKFPGVNEVEEIDDVDGNFDHPFVADAMANEKEPFLSEEQQKNYKKVKEEDDANKDRKLQLRLKRRRHQKRVKEGVVNEMESASGDLAINGYLDEASCAKSNTISNANASVDEEAVPNNGDEIPNDISISPAHSDDFRGSKRSTQSEDLNPDSKKRRTDIIDTDDEVETVSNSLYRSLGDDSVSVQRQSTTLRCTACDKVAVQVHSHPLLKVIICRDCKFTLEEKMCKKDLECSECYCAWCGQHNDLISCKSCKVLFCITCIKRNVVEEFLPEIHTTGWQCCCCAPSLLQKLTLDLKRALESEDKVVSTSDSDSETSGADVKVSISSKRKRKKKIRRIIDDAELGEETKVKIAIEKERQQRLRSLQVQFSAKSQIASSSITNRNLPESASVEVLGDSITGYIVNVVRENGEEAARIPPSISAKLKAHQVAGIRFLWENIIQSIRKVKSGDKGLGCILAHMMGLGKTLQVIAFLYTAMRSVDLGLKTALIVTPVNVLHNWRHEFIKWKPSEAKPLRVFMLEDVSRERRAELLAKWRVKGGVFLIGYTAFRNLSLGKNVKDRQMDRDIANALQDGPDILVCDEAHIIKNTRADTTQALKQVKCQRRIALTGSPLQNNLMEYYCMVDFVREGFLGSSHEFRNRFQNPIENGQHTNSTAQDVKIMSQRSHILYEQLKGFVQRMDMSVVKKDLPPKTVYVIAVKLSPLQRRLYKRFLDVHGFTKDKVTNEKTRKSFFAGYQALAQIWNHPGILLLRKENKDYTDHDDLVENFLGDDMSSDENIDCNTITEEKLKDTNDDGFLCKDWWNDLLHEKNYRQPDNSGKMVLLLDILTTCSDIGDKALVFSQSITTLDLIELYLSKFSRHGKSDKLWKKGKDWYRLDGRTKSSDRQKLVEQFNDPLNRRVKCTLISTKAGALGINLYAANRVIIVDGSWNPTYDLQAIYRAWRYGQKKPVFAYRLLAHGTMEEKIYKRQVTKEGLAARVVDRQQVHRTISKEEMLHLFEFGEDENLDPMPERNHENGKPGKEKSTNGSCVSDKLIENLLAKHRPRWIANYHEHETLLQENEEEKLSKEEQDLAWEVYNRSLEWEEVQRVPLNESNTISEKKPPMSNLAAFQPSETKSLTLSAKIQRSYPVKRKCTGLAHMQTLRIHGIKFGCSTVCGECATVISWKDKDKFGRPIM